MARDNIADVLCIGAQKTSTSWLHHVLNVHPKLHVFPNSKPVTSTNKEAHFWDWNRSRGVEWYRELMTPPDPDLMSMDFTPEYAFLPARDVEECKSLNPTARVIYVLRDPLSRAVSALRMHAKRETGDADPAEHRITFCDETLDMIGRARILEHSSYVANHARWAKQYDDILVLNYEDILATPREVVEQIYSFLGFAMTDLSDEQSETFETRFARKVWKSVEYPVDRDVLMFLHGLVWQKRQAAESHFGFEFREFEKDLDGAG
ncbi:MAG: sulfotransferase domain-containing protein [Pseudomonadota bacterium]